MPSTLVRSTLLPRSIAQGDRKRKERQMIRKTHLLALALVAAAIGAPVAHAAATSPYKYLGHPATTGGVDRSSVAAVKSPYTYLGHPTSTGGVSLATTVAAPVAQSGGYPIGRDMTPSEIASWTTGACSHKVKAVSCYRMLEPKTVDPLAVSYLTGQGLSPSEVTAWTTGICSHQVKDAACYAMFRPAVTVSTQSAGSSGFQWGDAGIGAGFVLGILLLASAPLLMSRQSRRREAAHA
jgi:hypothetical protein